jgi:hypothetical protein
MAAAKARRENFSISLSPSSERSKQIAGLGQCRQFRELDASPTRNAQKLSFISMSYDPPSTGKIRPAKPTRQEDHFPKQAKVSMNVLPPHNDP